MISFAELEIALLGLLRLARFDAGFAGFFDLTRDGARRSFRLALPLLPLSLLLLNLNQTWPDETDMGRVGAAELIGYALSWTVFPLLLIAGAPLIERGQRVYGAIAIYNWLSVLYIALQLPLEIAAYYGMGDALYGTLSLGVLIFVTACEFFAFKRILSVGIEIAVALVVVDFVSTQIISSLMVGMIHGPLF